MKYDANKTNFKLYKNRMLFLGYEGSFYFVWKHLNPERLVLPETMNVVIEIGVPEVAEEGTQGQHASAVIMHFLKEKFKYY